MKGTSFNVYTDIINGLISEGAVERLQKSGELREILNHFFNENMNILLKILNEGEDGQLKVISINLEDSQKDLIDGLVDLGIFPSRAEAGRFIFLFEYFSLLKGEFKKDYIHVPIPRIGIKRNPAKLESFREKAKIQKELWEKTINDKIRGEGEN